MQLRVARVCLDCEEVHDAMQCPVCASETYAFLSRWVPTPERRTKVRPPSPPKVASTRQVLVVSGVLGAAAYALTRWSRAARARLEGVASRQSSGELK